MGFLSGLAIKATIGKAWTWIVSNWKLILTILAAATIVWFIWSWNARGDKIAEQAATIAQQKIEMIAQKANAQIDAVFAEMNAKIAAAIASRTEVRKDVEKQTDNTVADVKATPPAKRAPVPEAVGRALDGINAQERK